MANFEKVRSLKAGRRRQLHRTIGKRFSVELIEGRDLVLLQPVVFGLVGRLPESDNFAFVRRGQAIPTGAIWGIAEVDVVVRYRVRSGRDFTGTPEFPAGKLAST